MSEADWRRFAEVGGLEQFKPGRREYTETDERLVQVKVLDAEGHQQGEAAMLTDPQVDELVDNLPDGWSVEEV